MEITEIKIKDMQEAVKKFMEQGILYKEENGIKTLDADRYKEVYGLDLDV
ncbi:hypothetical protein [Lachnoclostridium sp.]|nr:hypothetical protein [Lachnoclostridium sp.]